MTKSMTGFAALESAAGAHRVSWEIRSVNHRFLDVSLRLPEELKRLEHDCRDLIRQHVRRGKVDAVLKLLMVPGASTDWLLNEAALERLAALSEEVGKRFAAADRLSVGQILRFPGVLEEPALDAGALSPQVLTALDATLKKLDESRISEGSRLEKLLVERCDQVVDTVGAIRARLGEVEQRYAEKLRERLRRLAVEANPERLEQELAILAQRLDVAEELDRLDGHVAEIRAAFQRREPIGRRLDFLIQELNREANTLGSKSADDALSRAVVELKVAVEQMREQVQNIE